MSADQFVALVAFAVAMSATPGPNTIMQLASGATYGFRATIPHMLGVVLGIIVLLGAVGLGLGTLFVFYPALGPALKIASLIYMLWLAWRIAAAPPIDAEPGSGRGRPMTWLEAALFQWINPKAWAMAVTGVAAYTDPARLAATLPILIGVFVALSLPVSAVWTAFGVGLRRVLGDPVRARLFNIVMALLLLASLWPVVGDLVAY